MMTSGETKKSKTSTRVVRAVCIVVLVVCLGVLAFIGGQYLLARMNYSDLSSRVVEYDDNTVTESGLSSMTIDWDALRAECPDVIAWIRVPGTVIDYPVVQGPDNEYYLHRSYDGTTSWLSSGGTIFLDAANSPDLSDQNNVLYGHNMNDGSMFAELASWTNQETFNSHQVVYVLTPTMNYQLTPFALVLTNGADAIVQTTFATQDAFAAYVQDKLARSVVSASTGTVDAASVSKMFMLVTCEYSQNNGRACVCATVSNQAVPSNWMAS